MPTGHSFLPGAPAASVAGAGSWPRRRDHRSQLPHIPLPSVSDLIRNWIGPQKLATLSDLLVTQTESGCAMPRANGQSLADQYPGASCSCSPRRRPGPVSPGSGRHLAGSHRLRAHAGNPAPTCDTPAGWIRCRQGRPAGRCAVRRWMWRSRNAWTGFSEAPGGGFPARRGLQVLRRLRCLPGGIADYYGFVSQFPLLLLLRRPWASSRTPGSTLYGRTCGRELSVAVPDDEAECLGSAA